MNSLQRFLFLVMFFSSNYSLANLLPVQTYPPTLKKFAVILDAGHGGEDTGAQRHLAGKLISEKNLTLTISQILEQELKAKGIAVFQTRTKDETVLLDRRTDLANHYARQAKESIFVSIHLNSTREIISSGVETYVFNATTNEASKRIADVENGTFKINGKASSRVQTQHSVLDLILTDLQTTANFDDSMLLAQSVQNAVVKELSYYTSLPLRNRGVHQALFYVLMQIQMPGILFEPGFMSNPDELQSLIDPMYMKQLAKGMARGIQRFKSQRTAKSLAKR